MSQRGRFLKLKAVAACALFALASVAPADAYDRPRQSVLARVRAGEFAQDCARVAQGGAAAASRTSDGSALMDNMAGAPPAARTGVRVMPDGRSIAQLRAILARLEAVQAPPSGISPTIWIQDSPEIDARQRGAGDIYITRGTLNAIMSPAREASDDQITADVSFILAHEYAHVLMCHYSRIMQQQGLTSALDMAANLGVMAQYMNNAQTTQGANGVPQVGLANQGRFNDDVSKTMATRNTLQQLNSGLVNPAWGRNQERDADWLAVELLTEAQIPADYAPDLLSNLHTADANFTQQAQSIMGQLPQNLVSGLVNAQATGQPADIGDMLRSGAQRAGRDMLRSYLTTNLGHFHDDPDQRAVRIVDMIDMLGPRDNPGFEGWGPALAVALRAATGHEFAGANLAFEANQKLAANDVTGGCDAATRALALDRANPTVMLAAAGCAVARNDANGAAQQFNRITASPYAIPADFVEGSQIWAAARSRANADRVIQAGASRFGADSYYVPRMLLESAFSNTAGVTTVRDQCVAQATSSTLRTQECPQVAARLTGQSATAQAQPAQPTTPEDAARQVQDAVGSLFRRNN